jgi:hypothetical protein
MQGASARNVWRPALNLRRRLSQTASTAPGTPRPQDRDKRPHALLLSRAGDHDGQAAAASPSDEQEQRPQIQENARMREQR